MKWMVFCALAIAVSVPALAQSAGKSDLFEGKDINAKIAALAEKAKATGSAGDTLADYGSHKIQLSIRTVSGGAEIHAHYDDVMLVKQGTATLITGGTVVDAKEGPGGETHGKSIEGGLTRTIGPGDIITVNAGIPHQLLVPAGTTYVAIVIKVKE